MTNVNHNAIEAMLPQQFNEEFHNRLLHDRDHGLGHNICDWADSRPFARRQNHGFHKLWSPHTT